MKVWFAALNVTPAGRVFGTPVTDSVVPSSTSDALASALSATGSPPSVASPCTVPVTTGACSIPVIVHETESGVVVIPSLT